MPVRHEIKSQLAKLLATEDLIVENKKVETAQFNVHTRVLTLPNWDRASNNVYDSLVAHEVGHYKLKHILQGTILGIIETGIMLFAFNLIMNDISLFQVFGVSQLSVHAGIVFFSMLYAPVSMFTSIVTTAISRKNEYEADKYSYDTTNNREALVSMLIGLSANNLSHLTPHPLKVFLSYSHPPVVDRIKAVNQYS